MSKFEITERKNHYVLRFNKVHGYYFPKTFDCKKFEESINEDKEQINELKKMIDSRKRHIRATEECKIFALSQQEIQNHSQHPRIKQARGEELKPDFACESMDNSSLADTLSIKEVKKE